MFYSCASDETNEAAKILADSIVKELEKDQFKHNMTEDAKSEKKILHRVYVVILCSIAHLYIKDDICPLHLIESLSNWGIALNYTENIIKETPINSSVELLIGFPES